MKGETGDAGAFVIRNLGDDVADGAEGPLARSVSGGKVGVEDVARGVVVLPIGGIDFSVERGAQVPAAAKIRQDQLRLEGPVMKADVGTAVATHMGEAGYANGRPRAALNGAGRGEHTKTRFDAKTGPPYLVPGQLVREVGVVHAATHIRGAEQRKRLTDGERFEGLRDDKVVGRAQEGPAGNEQKALNEDIDLLTLLVANTRPTSRPTKPRSRILYRPRPVRLKGESLAEPVDARRRHACG